MFGRTMGCFSMTTFVGPLVHWISWAIPGLGQNLRPPQLRGHEMDCCCRLIRILFLGQPKISYCLSIFPVCFIPTGLSTKEFPHWRIEGVTSWPPGFSTGMNLSPMDIRDMTWRYITAQYMNCITLRDITCMYRYVCGWDSPIRYLPMFPLGGSGWKKHVQEKQPRSPLFRIPGLAGWHLWPRSLIDIPATFLDLAGAPLAPSMQGPLKGSSRPQPGPWFNRLTCVVQWQSVLAFAMWIGMHPPMMFLVHRKNMSSASWSYRYNRSWQDIYIYIYMYIYTHMNIP